MEPHHVILGTAVVVFVGGAAVAILYDLGIIQEDPEKAKKRRLAAEEGEKLARVQDEKRRQDAERRAQEDAQRRQEWECLAARVHLRRFYAAHKEELADACPPDLMEAFVRTEMAEGLKSAELWNVCLKKITELLPSVARGRKGQVRLKQIDDEIKTCRDKIERVKQSGREVDLIEDEIEGQLLKIKHLDAQKQLLTKMKGGSEP